MNVFLALAGIALLATMVTLVLGIRSMTQGGDEDLQASTRLMFRRVEFQAAAVALVLAAVFLAGGWVEMEAPRSDRLAVDLGVMPAAMIRDQYGSDSPEAQAYGGVPDSANAHLVTVSVRNREDGHRIDDASVTATVGPLGLSGTSQTLQPAEFGDALTYGNYFPMPKSGLYEIDIQVERPGVEGTDLVRLQYHRP